MSIDRDIHLARALLVESNPLLRSVGIAQLRDMGIGQVAHASRIKDARLLLEREAFDIVVCNLEFEGSSDSGQDLLDELRREKLLPHRTVFLMVTSRPSYNQVVEAAESALDGLLVRPYTAATLAERLLEARNRKRELAELVRALDAGEQEAALRLAVRRFQEHQPYASYCGRLAAELLLGMQRPGDARLLFEKLAQLTRNSSWAVLGVARCQWAAGDIGAARRTVEAVLAADPGSADAHDLYGRLLVELCDFEAAMQAYSRAAELTPACLLRAQHAGALAYYQGKADDSLAWLERTLGMGVQSRLFDALTLVLLAFLRHDRRDAPGVAAMHDQLCRYRDRYPESARLQQLTQAAEVLGQWLGPQPAAGMETLQAMSEHAGADSLDMESANVLLGLWARAPAALRSAQAHDAVLERLGLRLCVSKAMTEVLIACAGRDEAASRVIRRCQVRIAQVAEQAMEQALQGDPAAAVQRLLQEGRTTLNAKLLEMAAATAHRHADKLPQAAQLAADATALVRRTGQGGSHIAGLQRSGRSPGGLRVRGARSE